MDAKMGNPTLPEARASESLADPLTGFGDRRKLIADVAAALDPDSPPSVLAVFYLAGAGDYRRILGEESGDRLISRLAEQFARLLPTGTCYRPREDEFCAVLTIPIDDLSSTLDATAQALKEEGHACLVTASYGAVVLPAEAADPMDALMLADGRLDARRGIPSRRERRHNGHER
jgi:GGDEF domain-containing protein